MKENVWGLCRILLRSTLPIQELDQNGILVRLPIRRALLLSSHIVVSRRLNIRNYTAVGPSAGLDLRLSMTYPTVSSRKNRIPNRTASNTAWDWEQGFHYIT